MEHDPPGLDPDTTDPYRLYTRAEAADFLRCSSAWLTELTSSGQLFSIKNGRRRLYPRAALTAFIRGEKFDPGGLHADDGETWPPTPSLFGGVS